MEVEAVEKAERPASLLSYQAPHAFLLGNAPPSSSGWPPTSCLSKKKTNRLFVFDITNDQKPLLLVARHCQLVALGFTIHTSDV